MKGFAGRGSHRYGCLEIRVMYKGMRRIAKAISFTIKFTGGWHEEIIFNDIYIDHRISIDGVF